MKDKEISEKQQHDPKHIKMAIGIASDPRHKGGDYTGAHNKIEKIAKGLASHPQVAAVLKKQNEAVKEGLGDLADRAERDHEVQMARAELYKLAKYAIKLHEILKGVSEAEGLEGWVQSKITKSADYISSVYHHLDYEQATGEINDNEVSVEEGKKYKNDAQRKAIYANKKKTESLQDRLAVKLAEKSVSKSQKQAHQANIDAAQREMDRREAEGEDMTGAKIDQKTYKIIKPKGLPKKK